METDLEDDARGYGREHHLADRAAGASRNRRRQPHRSRSNGPTGALTSEAVGYSPLEQVNAENFGDLEIAWRWKAANYGPEPDYIYRATPIYVNGKIYTVAGQRRTVVCIDPTTGETLWMFRERQNPRWEASTRKNYGKGVAFARVDGRPVIFIVTPAYYLWALDADSGQPAVVIRHRWRGRSASRPGRLLRRFRSWCSRLGRHHLSAAPIIVNGVVVVGNSHDRGYYPENKENIPGIVRGYDATTGRMLWRFDPVPKPGEPHHDTWEEESWRYTGNASAWAPLSADSDLGLVYVPTDTPTNDYYGGSRLGKKRVRHESRCARRSNREGPLVLSVRASRYLELRHVRCASPARHYGRRRTDPRDRTGHQARISSTCSTVRPVNPCGQWRSDQYSSRTCPSRRHGRHSHSRRNLRPSSSKVSRKPI